MDFCCFKYQERGDLWGMPFLLVIRFLAFKLVLKHVFISSDTSVDEMVDRFSSEFVSAF